LFAALASPLGHLEALAPLPIFLYEIAVLLIAYRRANYQLPFYASAAHLPQVSLGLAR